MHNFAVYFFVLLLIIITQNRVIFSPSSLSDSLLEATCDQLKHTITLPWVVDDAGLQNQQKYNKSFVLIAEKLH